MTEAFPDDVPEAEVTLFLNTVTEAVDQAGDGDAFGGYHSLRDGLNRSRTLEGAWVAGLVYRYEEALRLYAGRHLAGNGWRDVE